MARNKRDYRAEYARRLQRGQSKGLSRSQARGHPKPAEAPKRPLPKLPKFDRQLEEGLQAMKSGKTLTQSAKLVHVAPERLRRYLAGSKIVTRKGRSWTFAPDNRQREMPLYSNGEEIKVIVDLPTAVWIGRYFSQVGHFISTNDPAFLMPFEGQEVVDVNGERHSYETDPNEVHRLTASGGGDSFEDVYRIIA